MSQVGIGIIGLGTVGTGTVKIIQNNATQIQNRVGSPVKMVSYCDKFSSNKPEIKLQEKNILRDYKILLKDPAVDIVIELIGGYEPARTIILEALKSGKHVVTANKAVLAKYWDEIFTTAEKYERLVYFEAAVGGGIPVIQGLNEGMAANRIKKIIGILNGTTNFILTRMSTKNISFQEALKQAQQAGFAEADPTFDIEGIDSAHKLAILSSIAFGGWIKISDVFCEGISKLNLLDIQYAQQEFNYGLKLLGIAKEVNGKVQAGVYPAFLPAQHPFLTVQDEYNAISIVGDAVDDLMFYGKGAGQMAAASAVVSDVIFLARHVNEGTAGKLPYVTYKKSQKVQLLDFNKTESKYYLRFTTLDQPGVLSKISGILGQHHVSISSLSQPKTSETPSSSKQKKLATILVTTHLAEEGKIQKAIQQINPLPFVKQKTVLIRIEE